MNVINKTDELFSRECCVYCS